MIGGFSFLGSEPDPPDLPSPEQFQCGPNRSCTPSIKEVRTGPTDLMKKKRKKSNTLHGVPSMKQLYEEGWISDEPVTRLKQYGEHWGITLSDTDELDRAGNPRPLDFEH